MNTDAARMHRLTLRFTDADLEAAFAEEQARRSLRPFRITIIFAGALGLAIWPAAIHMAPSLAEHMPRIVGLLVLTLGSCDALSHS